MKYKIVLTNVVWGNDYKNVRYFANKTAQETWFAVATKFTDAVPVRNLNAGNFTKMSVYVKTGDAGIGDIMSSNYAIIYDTVAKKYWYYFIVNSSFDSADQVRLDLEIDVIQSYYIDMTFGDAMIERAHLPRFNTSTNLFEKGVDTPLLTRDEIADLPKRIKTINRASVSPIKPANDTANLKSFLDNHVKCWIYAYLDAGSYTFNNVTFDDQLTYYTNSQTGGTYKSPYVVVCFPMTDEANYMFKFGADADHLTWVDGTAFFKFINDNIAHIYALKCSPVCPFDENVTINFTDVVVSQDLTIHYCNVMGTTSHIPTIIDGGVFGGLAVVHWQKLAPQYLTYRYTLPQATIIKTGINTYAKDREANPKLFNTDYRELKLTFGGNEYSFDIQKLWTGTKTAIGFRFFEVLTPEIAPTVITIDEDDTIYKNPFENRIGYVTSNDFTLPYSKDQLTVFLANNKNFFAQKYNDYAYQRANAAVNGISSLGKGLMGIVEGSLTGNPASMTSIGALFLDPVVSAAKSEMSIQYDKITTQYTLDNMRAGVDALANSNANVMLNIAVSNLKVLVEELEAIPNDLARAAEDMAENGFTYMRMGNIKNFDHIRSKWNYIKAYVEVIKTPSKIPNEVRAIIRSIFAAGVRFWNTDTWDFEQINLEV